VTRARDPASHQAQDLILLVLVALVTRAIFIYRNGTPEPDSTAMIAGMALGMSGHVSPGDAILYGRHVSPGMHELATRVFPALHVPPQHLLPILNWFTVICASLCVWPLYIFMRHHLARAGALACAGIWMFTPLVWESGTYYHPLVPATLLLLLSLLCARHIRLSDRGLLWAALTVALAASAFILRVEIVVVWPALLVWTLTSRRRARDTALLLTISVCAAVSYLLAQRALSGATPIAASGVGVFLDSITRRYLHSANLAGLPRSAAWMVFGMGVGALAACAVGLARFLRTRLSRNQARLVAAALAWALPSMLFWLPQPTPILRHYFLATVGIAVLLGIVLLARTSGRKLWLAAALIAAANLGVPEVFYRAYAARSPAPKTPHGAFFFYHQKANTTIERNHGIAREILSCKRDGVTARSCSLVRWELFAHLAYAAAVTRERVEPVPIDTIFPGVRYIRFRFEGGEARFIDYVYFEDDSLRTMAADMMRAAQAEGYCLFAPQSLCERVPQLRSLPEIQCY
jgi:hypothetical protein